MNLLTFLNKELSWSRHRLLTVAVLFLLVPSVFATGTLFFEHTLPENSPVAIAPASEDVSQNDLEVVRGAATFISDPEIVASSNAAFRQLHREEVYAVVQVPPDVAAPESDTTVDVYVDGRITIFRVPSRALVSLLSESLERFAAGDVTVERHVIGEEVSLSAYLLPTALMLLVTLAAFVYVPALLAREANVFDRLRAKASLESVVAAKLLFVTLLLVPSILVVYALGTLFGYPLEPLSLVAVGTYLSAFLAMGSVASAISFLTRFNTTGRVLNVAVFFALIPLSNLAYPAGFFSGISKTIARLNPLHYAMVIARTALLKEPAVAVFSDWLGWLIGAAVACVLALEMSIKHYERVS